MKKVEFVIKRGSLAGKPGTTAYAIVRSLTYPVPGAAQMDVLSPSRELFFWYRRMANAGNWNKRAFYEEYVPRFLKEIKSSPAARAWRASAPTNPCATGASSWASSPVPGRT